MKAILILLNMTVLLATSCNPKTATDKKPNIIMIVADDLGYGDLSCYGNTTIQTPNLDALAANGTRFTDFHSNGSVCSPTRAALMTGKYQQRTGVAGVITAKNHRDVGLPLDEITIAEEFKKYNYKCAIFGKWHLGYATEFNPILQGYNVFKGYVSGNVDYLAHIDQEGYLDWWEDIEINNEEGYSTDLITEYGVDYIHENNPDKTDKPFFLYLPYETPHGPYQTRESEILRTVGTPGTRQVEEDSIPSIYKEMVEIMDQGIGKIIQALKETGQYENSIVVFFSDNGANKRGSNGLLRGYKAGVYEGGSRVPAIFCYSGKTEPGTISDQVVLTMDMLPTLLDFIGEKPTASIDGISIKDHLLDHAKLPQRDVFYMFKNKSFIRSGYWKLIHIENESGMQTELYNLSDDLAEMNDVGDDHPELVTELSDKLSSWKKDVTEGVDIVAE